MKICLKIYNEIIFFIKKYKKFLVALSGGIDSMVLIDALSSLKNKEINNSLSFKFRAIHINYNINKYSKTWVKHCKIECKKRNIKLDIVETNLSHVKSNVEEQARIYRYNIFKKNIIYDETLLTAHNLDDQTETFLLALKRGSGPCGLSSIKTQSKFYKNTIIRPLLRCSRLMIKNYVIHKKIKYIYDKSNNNKIFDRNFLRIDIIPLIIKRWPYFNNSVFRSSRLCYEQEKLIDNLLEKDMKKFFCKDKSLFFKLMKNMDIIKIFAILRRWMYKNKIKMPSEKQINIIWKEVALSKNKNMPIFNISNKIISKYRNKLYILKKEESIFLDNISLLWNKNSKKIFLPNKIGYIYKNIINFKFKNFIKKFYLKNTKKKIFSISYPVKIFVQMPKNNKKIFIRFRNKKKSFYTKVNNKTYSLKKIFNIMCVPPWLRNRIPLLFYNEHLISAIGLFISDFGHIYNKKKILEIIWFKNN